MKRLVLICFLILAALFPLNTAAEECMEGDCDNGQGVGFTDEGGVYNGQWKDGIPHGQGILTLKKGKYIGEFKEGRFHGYGIYTKPDGTVRNGEWRDGKYDGRR